MKQHVVVIPLLAALLVLVGCFTKVDDLATAPTIPDEGLASGRLTVGTNPMGAGLTLWPIDSPAVVRSAMSPASLTLPLGAYVVRATRQSYLEKTGVVTVRKDGSDLNLDLVKIDSVAPPPAKPTVTLTASALSGKTGDVIEFIATATNAEFIVGSSIGFMVPGIAYAYTLGPATGTPVTITVVAVGPGGVAFAAVTIRHDTDPPKPKPEITSFTTSKTNIVRGEKVTLTATVLNARYGLVSPTGHYIPLGSGTGSIEVMPGETIRYGLVAIGDGGEDTASVQVNVTTVTPPPPPVTGWLTASPLSIKQGETTTISWGVMNADSVIVTPFGRVAATGSRSEMLSATRTYRLSAWQGGTVKFRDSVTVTFTNPPPPPTDPTASITAPDSVDANADFIISLTSTNGTSGDLWPYGHAPLNGTVTTRIVATTTFIYTVTGQPGTTPATASKTVGVRPVTPPTNPTNSLSAPDTVIVGTPVRIDLSSTNGISAEFLPYYASAPLNGSVTLQFAQTGPVLLTYRVYGAPGTTPAVVTKVIIVIAAPGVQWEEKLQVTLSPTFRATTMQLHNPAGRVLLEVDREYQNPVDPQLGFEFVDVAGHRYTPVIAYTGSGRAWVLVVTSSVDLPANLMVKLIYQGNDVNNIIIRGFRGRQ